VLSGAKDRVEFGADADQLVVGAVLDGEFAQLVVPTRAPGVRIEPVWSLDLARSFATVVLDAVELDEAAVLTRADDALRAVERQAQIVHVLQSAETAGATEFVFELTRQWATDRFAFGRPLASYQAIKHRMADMVTIVHAVQAIVRSAAEAVHLDSPAAPTLSRAAAVFAGSRSLELMQDCVQLHGGIGVTWEHDLHLYLRRATVNRAHYGTPDELTVSLERLLGS
jgi:alkylation response protein AidB-like acyl-CoA dehydrogenase